MNRSVSCLLGSILLVMIAAALTFAQQNTAGDSPQSAPQNAEPPKEQDQSSTAPGTATVLKVKTRLVVVDVVALDHKGTPVTDLKAEDFSVQEEGQDQKIRAFSFQQPARGTEQATFTPVTLPPGRTTNMPRFMTNSTLNVLLLDGINVTNMNQKFTHQEMLKFLEKLPAGQPFAVYALGSKLRMLQDFTTDPSLLKDAVKKAKDNSLGVRTPVSAAADYPAGMIDQMPEAMVQQVLRFGQDLINYQMDERVGLTLAEMSALARNLSGYPGRKNLIWISEAFPAYLFPVGDTAGAKNVSTLNATQQSTIRTYQTQIDHAADLLSNAQVAVYPVDAATLSNQDSYSNLSNTDSNGSYLGRSTRGGSRPGLGSTQANEIGRAAETTMNSHGTMNSIADQTGGKAFYNTNNIEKAIRESMEDGSTYYTLGYYPENKNWDGRFRKIVVKVNRPGLKLHYRQGFFAVEPRDYVKKDAKILAIDMGNALNIDNPISTALAFQASVAPPSDQTGSEVQIRYGIDPHAISFELKDDGLQHAAVDCGVRAYNKQGADVRTQGSSFNAALTADQYKKVMQMIFPCNQSLELPPGDYYLRLAVRDNSNGLIGTANAQVSVPAGAAKKTASPEEKKP